MDLRNFKHCYLQIKRHSHLEKCVNYIILKKWKKKKVSTWNGNGWSARLGGQTIKIAPKIFIFLYV